MNSNTFPKSARLLNSKDYGQVFKSVKYRVSDKSILLLAIPNDVDKPRVGIIVAKKHFKRAVDRNRIKRHIRESFRLNAVSIPNLDIVVLIRDGARHLELDNIAASLDKLWLKLVRKVQINKTSQ